MSTTHATVDETEPIGPMTWEEFLTFEQRATVKHEYVNGWAYPHGDWATGLAGASTRHNRIASNVLGELYSLSRNSGTGCYPLGADERIWVEELSKGYYSDGLLVCDSEGEHELYVDRPCLIVEVTSRNTARNDRGEKLDAYRRLASLQAYWIISQSERRVTVWQRTVSGWEERTLTNGSVAVPCLPDAAIGLDVIYDGTGR
jgi:Uma2 family endonuclease